MFIKWTFRNIIMKMGVEVWTRKGNKNGVGYGARFVAGDAL